MQRVFASLEEVISMAKGVARGKKNAQADGPDQAEGSEGTVMTNDGSNPPDPVQPQPINSPSDGPTSTAIPTLEGAPTNEGVINPPAPIPPTTIPTLDRASNIGPNSMLDYGALLRRSFSIARRNLLFTQIIRTSSIYSVSIDLPTNAKPRIG